MERAVNPEDPVDCLLFLTNGKFKFTAIPKGVVDLWESKTHPGQNYSFKVICEEREYVAWAVAYAYCLGRPDG